MCSGVGHTTDRLSSEHSSRLRLRLAHHLLASSVAWHAWRSVPNSKHGQSFGAYHSCIRHRYKNLWIASIGLDLEGLLQLQDVFRLCQCCCITLTSASACSDNLYAAMELCCTALMNYGMMTFTACSSIAYVRNRISAQSPQYCHEQL